MLRVLAATTLAVVVTACGPDERATDALVEAEPDPEVAAPAVTSTAFTDGDTIPDAHTCEGDDVPPPLTIEGVPGDSVEVVLVVDDPDAPDGTFVHWLVAGLPTADVTIEGVLPDGAVEGANDAGGIGWAGPCPPEGDDPHRYRFTAIPVAAPTDLEPGFSPEDLSAAVGDTALTSGTLTGRFGR